MEERFAIRSVLLVVGVFLAVLCEPTEQRPRCPSPADCGENTLGLGQDHLRTFKSFYQSAVDDPTAMKQLLETFLMQHNELAAETNGFETEEEENSTERPPTGTGFVEVAHPSKPIQNLYSIKSDDENSTERPPTATSFAGTGDEGQGTSFVVDEYATSTNADEEQNSTERPLIIEGSLADVVNQLNPKDYTWYNRMNTTTKDINDNQSVWELTTVVPQQLASPLDTHEFNFQTTTVPPQPNELQNLFEQVDVTTQVPVSSTKKYNISSYHGNIPPTKANKLSYLVNVPPSKANKKPTKRATTKHPHVILRPQQLDTFTKTPSGSQEKIRRNTTTKPGEQINSLMPVDRDQDIRSEIQLEILNRPISTSKPSSATTATPVGNATSSRPNKKPINIIPETIVKKGQKPLSGVGKPQGSGIRNPTPNATVAPPAPSEPDDYLISALASIATDGDEEDEDEDEEEDEEDEEDADSNESGEEDENEYLTDSVEENEERENFDYIDSRDASDVISSVMQEVGALI